MPRIIDLPFLASLDGTESFPLTRGGTTYETTTEILSSWVISGHGINRPPTSSNKSATAVDTDLQVTGNIFIGVSDPDADAFYLQSLSYNGTSEDLTGGSFATALGVMFLNPTTGDWTFTLGQGAKALNVGQTGNEIFTYTIADGKGGIVTSLLTITITGTNSVPVVNFVNDYTPLNTTIEGNLIAHYAFDYESALTVLHFSIAGLSGSNAAGSTVTIPSVGTIEIDANGDYTFVPVTDWYGPVPPIKYTLTDVGSPPNTVDAYLTLAVTPLVAGVNPIIIQTTCPSGPVAGGENGYGCQITLIGFRFGVTADLGGATKVYVGSTEVARYFPLVDSALAPRWAGMQALTVQVNNMASGTLGVPQPVTIVVGGNVSNANHTFTPNPGDFYYLSLSGNDTTGLKNDITKPFRTLQKPVRTDPAIWPNLGAGDHVIVRGGDYTDLGYDTSWGRFRDPQQMGSEPTGIAGSGWICFYPYGNEDAHYSTPPGGNKGGIQGPGQAFAGTCGEWIGWFNFRMDVAGGSARDAGPVNMQYATGHWKVVNNKLGPWPAGDSTVLNAAAITGAGNFVDIYCNYVHDIEGTSAQQNHGLYAGTLSYGWDVGFNWWQNCIGGSSIQFNDSDGGTGVFVTPFGIWNGFTNIKIHHNFFEVAAKYAINFADIGNNAGDLSFQAWNNLAYGTGLAPFRLNTTTITSECIFAYNTCYDCARIGTGSGNGIFKNEGAQNSPSHSVLVYNNILAFGPNTVAGTVWLADPNGASTGFAWSRNLYFPDGQTPANVADTLGIYADPKFNDVTSLDFTLQSSSPAINAGTQALPSGFVVNDDFTGQNSRLFGGAPDIGFSEFGDPNPFITISPATSGGAIVGAANTCSVGSWGNSPTGYSRRAYIAGTAVGTATSGTGTASYTPVAADSHKQFDWVVSATNGAGTTNLTVHVGVVVSASGAPVCTVPPAITGTAQAGVTLSGSDGTWTGGSGFAYQWFRGGVAITGATANTYALTSSDVGFAITFRVEALDATHGSTYATSSATSTVIAAAPSPVFVQAATGTTPVSTSGTIVMGSDVQTGNLMIAWFGTWDQAPDNFLRSDNQGHSNSNFTAGARVNFGSDNPHGQFLYVLSNANGSYTLTVDQDGGQIGSGVLAEIGAINSSSLFDIPQDTAQANGTAVALTASTATTKPNDLILVGVIVGGTGHTVTPGSGWTAAGSLDGAFNGTWLFYRKITSNETFAFTATIDSAANWVAQSMVCKGS